LTLQENAEFDAHGDRIKEIAQEIENQSLEKEKTWCFFIFQGWRFGLCAEGLSNDGALAQLVERMSPSKACSQIVAK
jgi:hypothetical protein